MTSSPLTVMVTCMSGLLSSGAGHGPAQRTRGELAGQVALVVDRTALVGLRVAVLGGQLRPAAARFSSVAGLAAEGVLGLGRAEVRRRRRR